MKKKMLVIGNVGVRLNLICDRLPYSGETAEGSSYSYTPDTNGGASALAFARMGIDSALVTCVGNDGNGAKLISILDGNGVDTRYIKKIPGYATALTVILGESEAGRRMIHYCGASAVIDTENVEEAFTSYPDGVLIKLDTPKEAVELAIKLADDKSLPVYVSAANITDGDGVTIPKYANILIADALSCQAIIGIAPTNSDAALRAAFEIMRKYEAKNIVLRMNNGCVYVYDGKYQKIISLSSKGQCFTDVFAPALISEYLKRDDIYKAAQFASRATKLWEDKGESLASVPTQDEVRENESEV